MRMKWDCGARIRHNVGPFGQGGCVLPGFNVGCLAVPGESYALDIYVSVDGGAQADGSLAKPYGSLPDAVEAVRALRKAGNTEPVVIKSSARGAIN